MDYLFYKFYRLSQRSSIPEVAGLLAEIFLTICLSFNFLAIVALLKKTDVINYFPSKNDFIFIAIGIFLLICLLHFLKFRYKRIIEKYKNEDSRSRVRGNLIVTLYVIFSFVFLLGIAFYKPGVF
ncbi:hypothetical protein EO244_04250 [Ancylomarina salipaludis]|uniref:Uncharacterized protein n=1 Tax=Ancylomarina salipaludis TaxID=2501299 RepID=A0A4Q1JPB8_9BACT|nr:hypothetical protein [Ancylomarina salipaludis]RXQ96060.1 hypothetical protein EO244_04250 [Ancylomarina salipaludis]